MNNAVRFVQLRRPISEILANDGTTAGAVFAANRFRDEILSLKSNTTTERYRARLIRQDDLWDQGVKLGIIMRKSEENEVNEEEVRGSAYYGGKWGVYLRAPDLWFQLLDSYGNKFSPLGQIAVIRRGITSGKDSFFFPIDCSSKCLEAFKHADEFRQNYGVSRKDVESGTVKLVSCGEKRGEIRPIESEFLKPELHSLMDIDQFTVDSDSCSRFVLLVDKHKEDLKRSYCLKYILWGEAQGFHKDPTCEARATLEHDWYDLTRSRRPNVILPKIQQYRLISILNPLELHIGSSLMGLYDVPETLVNPLCAILNSTISIMSRLLYARVLGNEGNIQLDVYSANMMLVPNPNLCKNLGVFDRINKAFNKMKKRKALQFLSERRLREMSFTKSGRQGELDNLPSEGELDMPDRRELDDAVLEMLGVESPQRCQELIDELYSYLREFFEFTRQKEEKAIINKGTAKRRGPARPGEIAAQIYKDITENHPQLLRQYDPDFLDRSKPFDTFEIPAEGTAELFTDMFVEHGVRFMKGTKRRIALVETTSQAQDELMVLVANSGVRGLVRLPHEGDECRRVLQEYEGFINQRENQVRQLIKERTADEGIQEEIYNALVPMLLNAKRP